MDRAGHHHHHHHLHPLDWAGHLRRALVLEPVPTALTLLVVAAHYHAVCFCSGSFPASASAPSAEPVQQINETSVTGYLFAGAALGIRRLAAVGGGAPPVRTPFHARRPAKKKSNQAGGRDEEEEEEEQAAAQDVAPSAAAVLKAAAMTDPFTLVYSAWDYISQGRDDPQQGDDGGRGRAKKSESINGETCKDGEASPDQGSRAPLGQQQPGPKAEEERQHSHVDLSWMHVCAVHCIGLTGLMFALVPSLLAAPSQLECNKAIPGMPPATAWPVVNGCVLVMCLSWVCCCLVHSAFELHQLAECVAMHSVATILHAGAQAATQCPLPPIVGPQSAARCLGCALGAVLLFVSQMHCCAAAEEDVEAGGGSDFYMHHAWAAWVAVCLGLRHLVFRGVCWGMCLLQREGIFAARAGYLDAVVGNGMMVGAGNAGTRNQ